MKIVFDGCPLYDKEASKRQKAKGCACQSPIAQASDCKGSLASGECSVPPIVWRKPVEHLSENGGDIMARAACGQKG